MADTILENIINSAHADDEEEGIHNDNIETLKTAYEDNTDKLIVKYKIDNKTNILENDIKSKKRKLREVISKHSVAQTKWKQVVYDNQQFEDTYKFYFIVSTLHFFILILLILGYLDIINNFIITIGIFVLYLIIIGVFVVKMDTNRDRNQFNYNEFNIKYDPSSTCSVKPTDVTPETTNNENELKKTTN